MVPAGRKVGGDVNRIRGADPRPRRCHVYCNETRIAAGQVVSESGFDDCSTARERTRALAYLLHQRPDLAPRPKYVHTATALTAAQLHFGAP